MFAEREVQSIVGALSLPTTAFRRGSGSPG